MDKGQYFTENDSFKFLMINNKYLLTIQLDMTNFLYINLHVWNIIVIDSIITSNSTYSFFSFLLSLTSVVSNSVCCNSVDCTNCLSTDETDSRSDLSDTLLRTKRSPAALVDSPF